MRRESDFGDRSEVDLEETDMGERWPLEVSEPSLHSRLASELQSSSFCPLMTTNSGSGLITTDSMASDTAVLENL